MKKYINIMYTVSFKAILIVLATVCTWFSGNAITKLFSGYIENPAAFKNVFTQLSGFDYESSEYVEQEIRNTVDCVMDYSLKYMKNYYNGENTSKEEYDYYMRLSNEGYKKTTEYLDSLKGVNFAVVNHDTGLIVSNIKEIDSTPAGTNIRYCFGGSEQNLIIVHNCKNPYFGQTVMKEYVDYIRQQAQNYSDDCDLYISFSHGLNFKGNVSSYEQLHKDMTDRVFAELTDVVLYSAIVILIMTVIFCLSGKAEKNGKIIASVTDQLPNDLILIFYIIIGVSVSVMLYNSFYMLYKSATIDHYGLGLSPDFYAFKIKVCLIADVYMLCAFSCKIKRQKILNTLYSNTYAHLIMSVLKRRKNESET